MSDEVGKHQLAFTVTPELAKRVADAAKASDRSVASYLRHAIRTSVERDLVEWDLAGRVSA